MSRRSIPGVVTRQDRVTLIEGQYTARLPDGEIRPVKVCGSALPFAQVNILGMGTREYAWQTVNRIAARGGEFKIDPKDW